MSERMHERRASYRTSGEQGELVAMLANTMMNTLWETLPEARVARLDRLGKILGVIEGPISGEVVRVVTLRGRTLGWWP